MFDLARFCLSVILVSVCSDAAAAAVKVTNQLGLSAAGNRKMVAAMEAADAAESAAGVARTSANVAAVTVDGSRRAVERLTAQIAGLQQRIAACNVFIRSNDFAVRPARQSFPDLRSTAHAAAR